MKTALELLEDVIVKDQEHFFVDRNGDGYVDISLYTFQKAMKLYAEQALDTAAEQSKEMIYEHFCNSRIADIGLTLRNFQVCYGTPKQTILKIKEQLK